MTGRVGLRPYCAKLGRDQSVLPVDIVRSRAECLIQLLSAFHDIADLDDIHQAAKRLDDVQAWIRREARMAAADAIFDDDSDNPFRITQASA